MTTRDIQRRPDLWRRLLATVALVCVANGAIGQEYIYENLDPEIEMWFYPTSSANGLGSVRSRASTFGAFSGTNEQGEPVFYPGGGYDPARRGSFIVVGDTSTTIPVGLDASRYQVDSVQLTLTLIGGVGEIVYDNTPDDVFEVTTAGGDDAGSPIEMWGIGFGGAYETFGFASEEGEEYFNEGDRRWPISGGAFTGPYELYAVDGQGADVENAVTGGYSATAAGNETDPFTPQPMAVGKVYDESGDELLPGSVVTPGEQFEFEVDLTDPGILEYVQQSLAAGHLGFLFSSLHQPAGHTGAVAYPDFYLDNEPNGPNPDGAGPSLEVSVTLLDASLPGDFDGNGAVDAADLAIWKQQFGQTMTPGTGADGDRDGVISSADYTVWRDNLSSGATSAGAAVPEPSAMAIIAGLLAVLGGWREPWLRPRRRVQELIG